MRKLIFNSYNHTYCCRICQGTKDDMCRIDLNFIVFSRFIRRITQKNDHYFIFSPSISPSAKIFERKANMARTGENIYKRKDGRWEGRFIYAYGEGGKAKYKYIYAKTYTSVKSKLIQSQQALETVRLQASTISEKSKYEYWLNEWLALKKLKIKDSTYIRYRNSIENHIKPHLGRYPIDKISTALMENFVFLLTTHGKLNGNGGLSSKTISDILLIIKESFQHARSHGIVTACNFDNITVKKDSHEMRVLTCSEMKMLISILFQDMDLYKLGVFLCLFTGIRIGELCALQWKNISIDDKAIKIEQTMQRLQSNNPNDIQKTRIIITEPKSFASVRVIPIPEFVVEAIKPYHSNPNSYLLSGESKRYVEPRTMQNRFKRYLKDSGIEDANFHSLRHTFATRCVEAGFDVKTLSEILGHSSVKITLDKYVHSSMDLKRKNMEKLQQAFP